MFLKCMTAEIFDFHALKKKWEENGPPEKEAPRGTFEISREYDFQPPVTSDAFYDEGRTEQNKIGERKFGKGRCLRFLEKTPQGPMFLFSGRLENEQSKILEGTAVYFGVIYNSTDPTRSHAI